MKSYTCRVCQSPFMACRYYEKRGPNANSFCSVGCRGKSRTGKPSGMLGKKHSESTKEQIRKSTFSRPPEAIERQKANHAAMLVAKRVEWVCRHCGVIQIRNPCVAIRQYCSGKCRGLAKRKAVLKCVGCGVRVQRTRMSQPRCKRCAGMYLRSIPKLLDRHDPRVPRRLTPKFVRSAVLRICSMVGLTGTAITTI